MAGNRVQIALLACMYYPFIKGMTENEMFQ